MGICPHSTESKSTYSTKALLEHELYNKMDFYFSTENLLRIDADCLLLFSDPSYKLRKNHFLLSAGKYESRKVTQYGEVALQESAANGSTNETLIFPIVIPQLKFRKVAIMTLQVWDGRKSLSTNIGDRLEKFLREVHSHKVSSIAITEFNQELGVPCNIGSKVIAASLYKTKQLFKVCTVLCSSDNSQQMHKSAIEYYKKDEKSISLNMRKSVAESNYY